MAALNLEILQPHDGQYVLPAGNPVTFSGRIVDPPGVPLFIKWYASLERPNPPGSPLPGGTVLDFTAPLGLGTQLIVFSVKDVVGDDLASVRGIRFAGVAGGQPSPSNPKGCAVHVLLAEPILPATGALTSRGFARLVALAPAHWGNQDYAEVNQLTYHWRLVPFGAPAGRRSTLLSPAPDTLTFTPEDAAAAGRPTLTYAGPLPGLDDGPYDLFTRVSAPDGSALHEASRRVTLTP